MPRFHVISAVFLRNLQGYFSGVLGYLFIVVFVAFDTSFTFTEEFFRDNLATLDQLTAWYPYLLLFFVPAVTMGVWADEKRQGTDELLFTMPATDLEILIGKYLAVASVYTIALLFTVTKLVVLEVFADPDWQLLSTTYLGYWLSGVTLLAAGMFASSLIANATAAFVVGVVVCAVPVFVGEMPFATPVFETLSLAHHLNEFGAGLVPIPGLLFFVSLTLFALYLNLVVITRRHWSADRQANMGSQFLVRVLCLAVVLVSVNYSARAIGEVTSLRIDATSEQLHTVSTTTKKAVSGIPETAPVTIQAFVSPNPPPKYVDQRRTLLNLLKQYARLGGNAMEVRVVETKPFSDESEEAEKFGIVPQEVVFTDGTGQRKDSVFLGAVVTSVRGEVVIPFLESTDSVEYQLTTAIATVTQRERLRVGLLQTDADLMGTRNGRKTTLVTRLEEHYSVESVSPSVPIEMHRTIEFEIFEDADEDPKSTEAGKKDEESDADGGGAEDTDDETDTGDEPEREKPEQRSRYLTSDPAQELDAKKVPEELARKLRWAELRLSDQAKVEVTKKGSKWIVKDVNPEHEYEVEKDGETVTVKADRYDVLMAVMPSSLTEPEMKNLVDYVETGRPVLIFDDPLPFHIGGFLGWDLSPIRPKLPPPRSQFGPPPQGVEKADDGKATALMKALDLTWNHDEILWDEYQPHPNHRNYYGADATYVSPDNGNSEAFSKDSGVTAGLEELLLFYPGRVNWREDSQFELTPLIRLGRRSGTTEWDDVVIVERSRFSMPGQPANRIRGLKADVATKLEYTTNASGEKVRAGGFRVAARITSKPKAKEKRNAIFVADVDMLGVIPLEIVANRRPMPDVEPVDFQIDNLTFVLNAIDVLGGREDLVDLRNRRPKHRILKTIEREIQKFRTEKNDAIRKQREEAEKQIEESREALRARSREINEADDLSMVDRIQEIGMAVVTEEERLARNQERIEQETETEIARLNVVERDQIEELQNRMRFWSLVAPPIPAVILGLLVLLFRLLGDRFNIDQRRLVSS